MLLQIFRGKYSIVSIELVMERQQLSSNLARQGWNSSQVLEHKASNLNYLLDKYLAKDDNAEITNGELEFEERDLQNKADILNNNQQKIQDPDHQRELQQLKIGLISGNYLADFGNQNQISEEANLAADQKNKTSQLTPSLTNHVLAAINTRQKSQKNDNKVKNTGANEDAESWEQDNINKQQCRISKIDQQKDEGKVNLESDNKEIAHLENEAKLVQPDKIQQYLPSQKMAKLDVLAQVEKQRKHQTIKIQTTQPSLVKNIQQQQKGIRRTYNQICDSLPNKDFQSANTKERMVRLRKRISEKLPRHKDIISSVPDNQLQKMVKTHIIEHFYKNVKIKANNYFSLPQLKIQQRAEASNKAFVSSQLAKMPRNDLSQQHRQAEQTYCQTNQNEATIEKENEKNETQLINSKQQILQLIKNKFSMMALKT